ncbi:hypothetical protein VDGD_09782 [Verticillium dahliae]|nr:hypothetical protein VDGD_09782 [Verticillium dahliae]
MDSPTKRRALAPLDANASSPGTAAAFSLKPQPAAPAAARSPLKASMGLFSTGAPAGLKRPLQEVVSRVDENGPAKKLCQDPAAEGEQRPSRRSLPSSPRREASIEAEREKTVMPKTTATTTPEHPSQEPLGTRSASPAVSSVFDASIASNAHDDTAMTDPELAQQAVAALGPRPVVAAPLTRAQAREKAQILRLRLGLANYKLRTGQADVPLERLQRRPVPVPAAAERAVREASVDSDATVEAEMEEREAESEDEAGPVVKRAETTPDVAAAAAAAAAQVLESASEEDAKETKPARGVALGGAATGLVSLARTMLPPSV